MRRKVRMVFEEAGYAVPSPFWRVFEGYEELLDDDALRSVVAAYRENRMTAFRTTPRVVFEEALMGLLEEAVG